MLAIWDCQKRIRLLKNFKKFRVIVYNCNNSTCGVNWGQAQACDTRQKWQWTWKSEQSLLNSHEIGAALAVLSEELSCLNSPITCYHIIAHFDKVQQKRNR